MQATERLSPPAPRHPAARTCAALAALLLAAAAGIAQVPAPDGRVLVSEVVVKGNRLVSAEEIRNRVRTRAGQEYVPAAVEDDVRSLYATRQFGNVYAEKVDAGPNRVQVVFSVVEYPSRVEKVEYRGAKHLKTEDLDSESQVRKGTPLNPLLNKLACRRIEARYHQEGRPFATCTLVKGGEPGDTEVIFQITEGDKLAVTDLHFVGNTWVSAERLRTLINTSDGPLRLGLLGSTYSPAMIEADVNELIKYYRSWGFHDVRVARDVRYSPDGRGVAVTFHIHEGTQYRVQGTPTVHGARAFPPQTFEVNSKLKAGDFYDQHKVDADLTMIRDWYGYQGIDVRAQATPIYSKESPGVVTVLYQVEERQPARVGQIFIVGNTRTRQNVILRQVPLYPGQVLSYPDIRQAERNLAKLNIFEASPDGAIRPTVTVLDNTDSPFKDILIQVQEANTGSLLFGVGVNSDSGLTGSIVLNERNFDITRVPTSFEDFLNGTAFRGAGQELRIEAVPGTQLQRYTISFREPFLFDSPYSLTTSAYFYQRIFNEDQEDRLGGRITLGRKINDCWSASVTTRLENVRVGNLSIFAPPDYQEAEGNNFLAGFRGGVTYDTRDSFIRPTEGSLVDVSAEEVTGTHTFTLLNLDASQYFTTYQRADGSGRHVLALHSQVGWASSNTPVYERYYAGGFRSIRGFQFRGVGPDVNGFKVGGDFLFLNSLEYLIPLTANEQVQAVAFVDSGTVTPRIDRWDDYRVSAGFGLRFTVPMLGPVPIALDFGFPIVKGPRDQEQVFNFWMGIFR
jgi:outer membrane protein insertion porin family